ncbi:uncharacterized protein LOC144577191 [Callithrix jacchus]
MPSLRVVTVIARVGGPMSVLHCPLPPVLYIPPETCLQVVHKRSPGGPAQRDPGFTPTTRQLKPGQGMEGPPLTLRSIPTGGHSSLKCHLLQKVFTESLLPELAVPSPAPRAPEHTSAPPTVLQPLVLQATPGLWCEGPVAGQKKSYNFHFSKKRTSGLTMHLSDYTLGEMTTLKCPLLRAAAETEAPAAPWYPARGSPRPCRRGGADPPTGGGGIRRGHFCCTQTASGCHSDSTAAAAEACPAYPQPPPGSPPSPSPGGQSCSPIVRSLEPGLLGSPSRGAGAGLGGVRAVQRRLPAQPPEPPPPPPPPPSMAAAPPPDNGSDATPPPPRPLPRSRPYRAPPPAGASSPAAFGLGRHLDDGRKISGHSPL